MRDQRGLTLKCLLHPNKASGDKETRNLVRYNSILAFFRRLFSFSTNRSFPATLHKHVIVPVVAVL